jgi:signal transduction histidine kinase
MEDGKTLLIHLPRPPRSTWDRMHFGFFWSMVLVGLAVALATYPIVRKLTRRLELLQQGVERWGAGDLSVRMPVQGRDEVAFLAAGFNQAAQRIETLVESDTRLLAKQMALLQAQKSLLANASHELRSPLTRIRMGLELLGGNANPHFREEISRNIAELDQLIEEILLASRLDAQEADMGTVESVDLTGLVAEECARVQAVLEVGHEEGGTSSAIVVDGVARLLRRLVRNLLENARRYSSGDITVRLRTDDGRAILSVCDRGPGVPLELRQRIFEPFYRLPGASEREGGVGLGLSLVKSIAARHAGSVRCEEHAGGGACFIVELPLPAPHEATAAAA